MKFQHQSLLFQKQALNGFNNAKNKLLSQSTLFFRPYYTDNAQRQALNYPFLHTAQCLGNAVSIVYGTYLFGKSILTLQSPIQALTMIVSTLIQCATLILNVCNLLMSLCSLGSRFLATLINGKYVFEPEHVQIDVTDTNEIGPIGLAINNFQVTNERLQQTEKQKEAEMQEEENCKLTYTFI